MNNNIVNLRDTIVPKSDQLNADDLIGLEKVIVITGVNRGNAESPISINYEGDDGRPFKPCKTVRKILIFAWGENGNNWVGRSMKLYCDPSVKYAGKEVGGIRVSAMSDTKPFTVNLATTKGTKKNYSIVELVPQQKPPYPSDKFTAALPAMQKAIQDGKTPEQVITQCEQRGILTDEQRAKIRKLADKSNEQEFFNDEGEE